MWAQLISINSFPNTSKGQMESEVQSIQESDAEQVQDFINHTSALILSGMAKAGDKPDTIKKNVNTATEYSKALFDQSKLVLDQMKKLKEIDAIQKKIEEAQSLMNEMKKKLETSKNRINELKKLRSDSQLWEQAMVESENENCDITSQLDVQSNYLNVLKDQLASLQK